MGLLAGTSYDPASAATKVATGLLAMTALDTTNLRLTFTAPANGNVLVRIRTLTHATAVSTAILLGVLDGATVKGRQVPLAGYASTAGTTREIRDSAFLVTGLTPGTSYTYDAAYAVQVTQTSGGIKYGGPNDASSDNAFGAIDFSIWSTENLLAGKLYDPGTAATSSLASLAAMAALDTTNLRLTFAAPPSGAVLVRLQTVGTGSTGTRPQVLLGALDGATVKGRMSASMNSANMSTAANSDHWPMHATFLVTGLTPSTSYTYDAAYGVEIALAATTLSWGGPDNTTGNNAWGGFAFEVWRA